ncbi:MAG TPA: DNA-binding protein [Candidatus Enterococcus avicola]|uniref:DNA-binding protein n=1 Tax=Candidatus Enterococcus avicola TaxID=2838561 RepID=A0A9D2F7V5_9ENTE|nr:DNA-binding protein [Candidatus Enterococcus avicola]
MMNSIQKVFDTYQIPYHLYEHPPVFTVEEAKNLVFDEEILEIKNLFLRNKKKSAYYLFSLREDTIISLEKLAIMTDEKKLSFASKEDLWAELKVTPGAVSILNVANDRTKMIYYYVEKAITTHPAVAFHPNRNDQTFVFHGEYLEKLMNHYQIKQFYLFES